MRIAAFVASVIIANLITIGGVLALVLTARGDTQRFMWLAFVALAALVYAPLLLGALRSYWDLRASAESWRYFRRWIVVIRGAEALGAVACIAFAVLTGASLWFPVGYVVVAVLLDLLARKVGGALLRREEERRPLEPPWEPLTRQQVVRKILVVATTFVVVLVVAAAGLTLLVGTATDDGTDAFGTGALLACSLAFIGAALACVVVSLQLNRQLREQVSRDVGLLRRLAEVVLQRKAIQLDADEQVAAAKYAVLMSLTLPFTIGYLLLLYIGLGLQQVSRLQDDGMDPFAAVVLVLLVGVLLGVLPVSLVRLRRARAYAAAHRGALPVVEGSPEHG